MATNIIHKDSNKYQKALTLEDRVTLEKIISTHRDNSGSMTLLLNDIANMLEKDPTTLSKEVKSRRTPINYDPPKFIYTLQFCASCENSPTCGIKNEVKSLKGLCDNYKKRICKHLKKFPWVCNGCKKKMLCQCVKSYYNPIPANDSYKYTLMDSRQGVYMKQSEFSEINEVLSNGLNKKQSIEHIIHSNDLPICTKTAYNYLHAGYINADLTTAHRIVTLKTNGVFKPHNSKILIKAKIGKHYEDFMKLLAQNPGINYTQMDTVEGTKSGNQKVILSLKIVNLQFQFYFLLESKTAECVVKKLNEIQDLIGINNYKKLFGVILTDNGPEFSDIDGIMFDSNGEYRTNLFFCHPQCSGEKGSCERNHELLRYILPKGTSFNKYNQQQMDLITSHVNSLKRKSTDFSTPIEKFYAFFGKDILDKLNIKLINPNDVILSRELLK